MRLEAIRITDKKKIIEYTKVIISDEIQKWYKKVRVLKNEYKT